MKESITEVGKYFMMCDDKDSAKYDDSIKLFFDDEETPICNENHFKFFEGFYMGNKWLFTPAIITNIKRTS